MTKKAESLAHFNTTLKRAEARAWELEPKLAAIIEPLLVEAGDRAADQFEVMATDHLTAAAIERDVWLLASDPDPRGVLRSLAMTSAGEGGVGPLSTMVAVKPRPDEAQAMAVPGGLDPDTIHVTLVSFGDYSGDLQTIADALISVGGTHAPLEGEVGGRGEFADHGNGAPSILLPSVPGLVELRVDVTEALQKAGVDYNRNFGFLPHSTVTYVADGDTAPETDGVGTPLHFDAILVVRGDTEVVEIPLTGAKPVTASVVDGVFGILNPNHWSAWDIFATADVIDEIAAVAERHAPDGGYGDAWWHEADGKVFWVSADWSTTEEVDTAVEDFLAIEGVNSVDHDAEAGAPSSDLTGWVRVYPGPMPEFDRMSLAAAAHPDWTPPAGTEVLDVEGLIASLRTKTDPVRQAVVETTMKTTLEGVGIDYDVTNPFVSKVLQQTGSQITEISQTTQLNVMRIIKESYNQGLSIPDTSKAIRVGMTEAAPARATLIARTELAGAVNGGSLAATKVFDDAVGGAGLSKQWLTSPGAKFPRHEEYEGLDGQTTTLDGFFDVGGFQMQFPGDPDGPPEEVCNCRCTMVYVEGGATVGELSAEEGGDLPSEVAQEGADELGDEIDTVSGIGNQIVGQEALAETLAPESTEAVEGIAARPLEMPTFEKPEVATAEIAPDLTAESLPLAPEPERPFGHYVDVTLKTQIYRSKVALKDLLTKDVLTAEEQATYAKQEQRLKDLLFEKRYRERGVERPFAHYVDVTLKTQIYRSSKTIADLEAKLRDVGLTEKEGDDLYAARKKLDGLVREKELRGKEEDLGTQKRPRKAKADKVEPAVEPTTSELRPPGETEGVAADLSGDERIALVEWTGDGQMGSQGYSNVNDYLRDATPMGPRLLRMVKDTIDGLDSAIQKASPLDEDRVLYRAYSTPPEIKAGDVLDNPGFMSTTTERSTAETWAGTHGDVYEIHVPAGTRALNINGSIPDVSRFKKEREFLLGRNQKLVIDKVTPRVTEYPQTGIKVVAHDIVAHIEAIPDKVEYDLTTRIGRMKNAYQESRDVDATSRFWPEGDPRAGGQGMAEWMSQLKSVGKDVQDEVEERMKTITRTGSSIEDRRRVTLEVLSEVREMGPVKGDASTITQQVGNAELKKLGVQAQAFFPTDWLRAAAPRGVQYARVRRGYFQQFGGKVGGRVGDKIAISEKHNFLTNDAPGFSTMVHEWGHRMESAMIRIRSVESAFYDSRTYGDRLKTMAWSKTEWTREDEFADPYVGRDYSRGINGKRLTQAQIEDYRTEMPSSTSSFEILSMGMEGVFNGGYSMWERDPDMVAMILGMLVGI